jgi:hypothetical protein
MTDNQRNKFDTLARVAAFNKENETQLATIEEYADEQTIFDGAHKLAKDAAQAQAASASTDASTVDAAKQAMSDKVYTYASRAAVVAKRKGNSTLANLLSKPKGYFYRADKTLALQRAKETRKLLNDNLATLTNIDAKMIAATDDAIAAYETIKDNPVIDLQARKAEGTNPLPGYLNTAFDAADGMFTLVQSYFEITDKPFVDTLALAKQIISTGVHHTSVEGVVSKNDIPLVAATVKILGTKKETKTDIKGHYIIARIKPNNYNIEVSAADGSTATKTVAIIKGNTEIADFSL